MPAGVSDSARNHTPRTVANYANAYLPNLTFVRSMISTRRPWCPCAHGAHEYDSSATAEI